MHIPLPHWQFKAAPRGYTGNDVLRKLFLGVEKGMAVDGETPIITLRQWQPVAHFAASHLAREMG